MIESYKSAVEEFKRVDHLYFVTLKYTRTVDVIRSTIERLLAMYEYAITAVLRHLKEEKKIEDIPGNPVGQADIVREHLEDGSLHKSLDVYLMLRRLMRQPYGKREEFRRHVTMMVNFEGKDMDVDIDLLKEYYDQAQDFLRFVKGKIESYVDEPT